jgi:hypothetical protein
MRMGAENMFRKVFGRKGVREAFAPHSSAAEMLHPALNAELQRLDLLRSGLGRKAIHYVATGERGDLFAQLLDLSTAGDHAWKAYRDTEPRHYTLFQATDIAVIRGEIAPGPIVLRALELRLAATQKQTSWSYSPRPQETLLTTLSGMLNTGLRGLETDYRVDWSKAIALETVRALFTACGGGMAELFGFLLSRGETINPAGHPDSWSASAACRSYLHSDTAAFVAAMRESNSTRRASGLTLAVHHGVWNTPEVEALIVAMLAKPFTKEDRTAAVAKLARLDASELLGVLGRHLATANADTRLALVEAAGRAATPEIIALLDERAKVEKTAKVQAAIAAILETADSSAALPEIGNEEGAAYLAVTGETVRIPARTAFGDDTIPAPTAATRAAFDEVVVAINTQRRLAGEAKASQYLSKQDDFERFYGPQGPDVVATAFATLTQAAPVPRHEPGARYVHRAETLVREVRGQAAGQKWLRAVLGAMPVPAALRILAASRSEAGSVPPDVLNLIGLGYGYSAEHQCGPDLLREWLADGRFELRHVVGDKELRQVLAQSNSTWDVDRAINAVAALPADAVWPWLAENVEVFDEAFGLRPAPFALPLDRAMKALALLPATPQRYLPRLTEIAVAEKRPLRLLAMALLRDAKDLPTRIEALLDDKRQPVRVNAAGWLADIRATASEPALRKRLKKETSTPVRTALIVALERLGADLSDVIGPASLIAEAEKANAKAPPKLPEWLVANRLPQVRFKDGASVPQAVVEYWMALAIRLKDPGAHGQFGIYLDQLEPGDARALSGWVLESWIAYDTATATTEQAAAYATANYAMSYRWICSNRTPADRAAAIAEMTRDKQNEMLNSGSDTKGLLALACRADPVWAAGRVRWFLKKHGRRSNQAMALLEAIAGTGAPAALQVVIAASARLKQKSTQARAAEIAQRYADDRGWSVDELADRTVPSAGFDDDGELDLPCGEDAKPYVARLDAALAIHLFNPDGKVVKALPAGDDDNTRESKKAFTAAKKELAQVIELQATRLFEAMCVERQWPVADWRLAFHQHPVMRRLIERLVWQGLDAEGAPLGLFRPTQEGDFTDAADNDVAIDDFAAVRLAHGALVDAETCKTWTAHLKDYEVKPFLAQFDNLRAPLTPELAEAEAITDRQGWAADSRTFRGAAEKRGYQRVMRDSGGCHEYVKEFPSHGITATIWHSGSYAVDENVPQALTELKFTKAGHRGVYRLKDVPPVLLAECWADYHAVAARGAFDPEWEKISPW